MSIDVSQFVQAFLDESFEGLDLMEVELLREEALDLEQVNAIFRAAHSIKGSAATFGFTAVGEFTHGVETLLDQVRDGTRQMTARIRSLLLESVDRVRDMLTAARDGSSHDAEAASATRSRIADLLQTAEDQAPASPPMIACDAPAPPGTARQWQILFVPAPGLLRSGNDPLRIFEFLGELGTLAVQCKAERLPPLADLDPTDCHLQWELHLDGDVCEAQIREAFEWVEDDCDLTVTALDASPAEPDPVVARPAPAAGVETTRAAIHPERRSTDAGSIRVAVEKVDALVNMVGELVITQAMLTTVGHSADELDSQTVEQLRQGLNLLERNTRELQEAVLGVRMLPINFVFSRFPRLVRDLSDTLQKQVSLRISGEETELDKGLIEKLADPLTHLVRNAIDHGIEKPEQRLAAGKPAAGVLNLRAAHQGGNIVIEISDDGGGLDRERILAKARERRMELADDIADKDVWQLIFMPGFSTAAEVTDVSGRGVGMDVVKRNIEGVNGRLDIDSTAGEGTRITIRLPLTLAILDGMSVRIGDDVFIVPLTAILESLKPEPEQLHNVSGRGLVVGLRGDYIPVIPLHHLFNIPARHERIEDGILVVVESTNGRAALFVDELVAQHQVVIKSLESNYRKIPGVSGATIMGDGRVALILDVDAVARLD